MAKIRTAVFPVAGRGTRFLPATKASPKEMLPVVDKPLIQYAAEEALAAGAEKLVFITGYSKRAIEDHFDTDHELEQELQAQGKRDLLAAVRGIVPSYASCIYIRQPAPLGLGHAVLCSRPVVGDEPFFVHLADDLIDAEQPCLAQMARVYEDRQGSVLGVEEVEPERDRSLRNRGGATRGTPPVAGRADRGKAQASRCALDAGGRRTLRADPGASIRSSKAPTAARAARSSSRTASRHCCAMSPCSRTPSRANVTIAARSWATWKRAWSSVSSTRSSASRSRNI